MSTLSQYKQEIRNIFFASVKNDLNLWTRTSNYYYSPPYYTEDKLSHSCFRAGSDISDPFSGQSVELHNSENGRRSTSEKIATFAFLIFPIDFKIWLCVRKIKKHFKKVDEDEEASSKIDFFKNGLDIMEKNFKKEIRKNKLEQISKNARSYAKINLASNIILGNFFNQLFVSKVNPQLIASDALK